MKRKRVMVSLDQEVWAALEARRLATGAPMAEVVRRALRGNKVSEREYQQARHKEQGKTIRRTRP